MTKYAAATSLSSGLIVKFGAISFIQRFGNTLNYHPHFHFIVADGIFEKNGETLAFHEAVFTPDYIADVQDAIEKSVLKLFNRRGWFNEDEVKKISAMKTPAFLLMPK